jgi:hypothetical protein
MGLVIALTVTAASIQDRDAAAVVAQAFTKAPGLEKLYTDVAYGGKCACDIEQLHHIRVKVVRDLGTARREPCTIQSKQLFRPPEVTRNSWFSQSAGWPSILTPRPNAGAVL